MKSFFAVSFAARRSVGHRSSVRGQVILALTVIANALGWMSGVVKVPA
jgi:hypothetical protein